MISGESGKAYGALCIRARPIGTKDRKSLTILVDKGINGVPDEFTSPVNEDPKEFYERTLNELLEFYRAR